MTKETSRRDFLQTIAAAGFGALATSATEAWSLEAVTNPLATYPDRGWEQVYRDLWKYDSTYTFTCAPNDTHNCLLNAYVRQGVITRIGPTMRYGEAKDLAGKGSTHRWDPRVCQKGLALTRRFYGDRRVNQTMVRAGFKRWYEAGFPRGKDGRPDEKYFDLCKCFLTQTKQIPPAPAGGWFKPNLFGRSAIPPAPAGGWFKPDLCRAAWARRC